MVGQDGVSNGLVRIYREKLWPTPWVFLGTALVIPASLLVFLPINETAGIVSAAVLYSGCVILLVLASPVLVITSTELVAGRARIPIELIGPMTSFAGAAATAARGPDLDARAFLVIRGWIDPVVRIDLTDPDDPTPYWLLSTRHPDRIESALAKARIS